MSTLKKITLHIGMSKTGTSSIQSFLQKNKGLLVKQGVYYPKHGVFGNRQAGLAQLLYKDKQLSPIPMPSHSVKVYNPLFKKLNGFKAASGHILLKESKRIKLFKKMTDDILSICASKGYQHCLISAEEFFKVRQDKHPLLFNQLNPEKVHLVIFLRRQDLWIESTIRQIAKGAKQTKINQQLIENVCKRSHLNYYNYIKKWVAHVPPEQITIVPYPSAIGKDGLEKLFCDTAGIQWDENFKPATRENLSFNRDAIEWYTSLDPKHITSNSTYLKIIGLLEEYSDKHPDPKTLKYILPPERRKEILDGYKEANTKIEREFLKAPYSTLFKYDDLNNPAGWEPYTGLTAEKKKEIDDLILPLISEYALLHRDKEILHVAIENKYIMKHLEKVTFHIGMPKTGTSTIQSFLDANRPSIKKQGVLYPKQGLKGPGHLGLAQLAFNDPQLDNNLLHSKLVMARNPFLKKYQGFKTAKGYIYKEAYRKKILAKLLKEIDSVARNQNTAHCLLSAEAFFKMPQSSKKYLFEYIGPEKVRILVFFRRQDLWLESGIRQRAKVSRKPLPQLKKDFIRQSELNYYKYLNSWSEFIPKSNIIVAPFPRAFKEEGIEKSFCHIAGIPWSEEYKTITNVNESLNRDATEWIIESKKFITRGTTTYYKTINALAAYSKEHPENPSYKFIHSPQERKEFLAPYLESNAKVEKEFLHKDFDTLFENEDYDAPSPWKPYPGLSEEKRVEIGSFLKSKNINF